MNEENLRTTEIKQITEETPTIKTYRLQDSLSAKARPGQFVMLWVPGTGEIPLAVSASSGSEVELTVKKRGSATSKLHKMEAGDILGLKGPFGNGFSSPSDNCLLIGGGYGIAPLRHLYRSSSRKDNLSIISGASSSDELLFLKELKPDYITTEDGSKGEKGTVIGPMKKLVEKRAINKVYTSGPEKMIYRIFEICKKKDLALEASLERVMKCGVGLCGSCLIDGFRVCQDGPVADLNVLNQLAEFGKWERSFSGKKEPI